ncbi:hypothetical protein EAX61_10380 [Dokdonia sinensis]|uniref:Uncharacterized protein n=1 Tax=Dokdonia sinensis TaxID=2479847 RepID=A0A3M0GL46_9FLAO|nr:hypothetical protein [Dokdonia sinensis]RMB58016.1 hypothetical protein EAX61_10380 [Dokdonia sinensis]
MKNLIILSCLLLSCLTNAQILWDDFSTGEVALFTTKKASKEKIEREGKTIIGNKRTILYNVGENPYDQLFQFQIKDGLLISSTGFGTASSMTVSYGGMRKDALNMDLSKYKTVNISFKGKSNFARVYLNMWTNGPNRAFWRGNGKDLTPFHGSINDAGHHKGKVITMELSHFTKKQPSDGSPGKFEMSDVDGIKFEFYGYPSTGLNYAIDKIWVE